MSTTVTYKGNTLTTVNNQTRVLNTAGTYLEDDITLVDVSGGGGGAVVVTEESDTGGGVVKNITAVDISNDTVDAAHLLSGYTAHDHTGTAITGTYVPSGSGDDTPVFTVTWDSAWENILSVTCDKTFLECHNHMYNDGGWGVFVEETDQLDEYKIAAFLRVTGDNYDVYTLYYNSGEPRFDIRYNSDNTISIIDPSGAKGVLNVTENGTYYPWDLASGQYISEVDVDVAGNAYTRTLICPQQTFTGDSSQRRATLTGLTTGFVDGAYYIVTYDNVEWLTTCETLWSTNLSIGEVQWFLTTLDSIYPFGVIWESGNTATVAAANTNQHTIKIERLDFIDDPSPSPTPVLQNKTVNVTPTESAQTQTVTADSGYDGLDEVEVNVSAISSSYVGSGVSRKSSSDLTASGATVTVPAGYYESQATKVVSSGTAGTPSAAKGTVSNHSITVTPSVTNSAGYISGGTISGSGVSVSASELVSGTLNITASGTTDVTNYASVSVSAGTAGTPTATKGTVSNHSIAITPSVTNTAGYISSGTKTGTAVSVSASELVSGSQTITSNGTVDVTNLASVTVALPFQSYYTGSSAPSASLGANGDIYLQTS